MRKSGQNIKNKTGESIPDKNFSGENIPDGSKLKRAIFSDAKDLVSGFIHLAGMLLAVAGLVLLVVFAVKRATVWHVVTFSVYGATLISLYFASTFYHIFYISEKVHKILRKIDHMMIYMLIAGTYTPICLVVLRDGPWGWAMFGCIWGFALAGILVKVFWMDAPRWLYTLFYIIMGWAAIVAIFPLTQNMPSGGLIWLFVGGLFYTVGGVCYALKWPRIPYKRFGFHELFHIFILLGSISHFIMIFRYIMIL